ncbi:CPBP family intramembrane glutamic endopeptidase [Kitasatospora sp. NPDC049285]|uniref:CPBP family intramembrane glutamic endopeptidase n=1 Tax=Kitasatospora sp. NPDC049285 TaxID=3157096 RepID=UPI003414F7C2
MVAVALVTGVTAGAPGPLPLVGAAASVLVYRVVMHRLAGRETPEIDRRGARREFLLGSGLGLGFVLVSALLITAFGGYSFSWADGDALSLVTSAVIVAGGAAVAEELMFRGLALQALEQRFGSRVGLVVPALFFGLSHLANPGASPWSALAIALEAGGLLGAAFLWRRSIWFVVGLHFAWNGAEQLLGIPVSGHPVEGVLTAKVDGPALLNGGVFGLETSIVPVVIGVLLAVPMLVLARRRGGLVSGRRARR